MSSSHFLLLISWKHASLFCCTIHHPLLERCIAFDCGWSQYDWFVGAVKKTAIQRHPHTVQRVGLKWRIHDRSGSYGMRAGFAIF